MHLLNKSQDERLDDTSLGYPRHLAASCKDILRINAKGRIREVEGVGMKFRVTIEQDEDGSFVTQCPSLPGCISEGKSREEALSNVRDAIHGYLASLKKHDEPIPPPIEEETVEVSA